MASGSPPTHAAGYPPQLVMPPTIGAVGMTTDFGLSLRDVGPPNFGFAFSSNAAGASLEMATNGADGVVGGIGGGGGIFLPGDPVPEGGWLVGAFPAVCWLVLALASGELATVVPIRTFAEGARILGSSAGGAVDPAEMRVGVSAVILVITSQVEDGPISCSWVGTEESSWEQRSSCGELVCELGLMTTNDVFGDCQRSVGSLVGDSDGFLLGQTDGFPVGASVGALVGKSEDRAYRLMPLRDLNLRTLPFDCFAFQKNKILIYEV